MRLLHRPSAADRVPGLAEMAAAAGWRPAPDEPLGRDVVASVGDALAFLQQLSDDDRERLAHSDTALADFADVRTPEQAMLRLQTMDPARRMQLMALFMR